MRWLKRIAIALAALALLLVVVVEVGSRRKFDAPYPDIHASNDPKVVARGKYIVYGAGHCVNCHVGSSLQESVRAGQTPLLEGGLRFKLPVGEFYTPNLTPDNETGIGYLSDQQIARVIRYGVMPDGRAALPFMTFQDISDEDLTAIVSFLRSQDPVRHLVTPSKPNFLGKAIMAFLLKPSGPTQQIAKTSPAIEPTVERGAYVANNVAICWECHTKRNPMDGSFQGAKFAGGGVLPLDGDESHVLVTPNLTPSKTGRITDWSEDRFVGRFQAGVGIPGTHMPWRQFASMNENDIRAIYRYLRTLPPSDNDPGPSVQTKKGLKEREKQQTARLN